MRLPSVLVLAGHDPTGGAGLIADAESIRAMGAWPLTVATALTRQTTVDVVSLTPRPFEEIVETARVLLEDCGADAIKVGLIADKEALEAVVALCREYAHLPIVIDPVLKAGGGCELSDGALIEAFVRGLLPLATLSTPNVAELFRLSAEEGAALDGGSDDAGRERAIERCARALLSTGSGAMLVTGTDVPGRPGGDEVVHRLYRADAQHQWRWPRLAGTFHGSGCTLSSAIAATLARGETLEHACEAAQRFTWQSLAGGLCQGRGQMLPDRLLRGRAPDAADIETDQRGERL